jgi:hypothetical protein
MTTPQMLQLATIGTVHLRPSAVQTLHTAFPTNASAQGLQMTSSQMVHIAPVCHTPRGPKFDDTGTVHLRPSAAQTLPTNASARGLQITTPQMLQLATIGHRKENYRIRQIAQSLQTTLPTNARARGLQITTLRMFHIAPACHTPRGPKFDDTGTVHLRPSAAQTLHTTSPTTATLEASK